MFVLLGSEINKKIHVLASNESFIIWDLAQGLDNLDSRGLPSLGRGEWASFDDGDFRSWPFLKPAALEVVACRMAPEQLERLGYTPWKWLRYPLVALINSDYASEFELVPVELVEPEKQVKRS